MFQRSSNKTTNNANKTTVEVVASVLNDHNSKTSKNKVNGDLVGAIDQGTSSTRFVVFTPKGEIAAWAQMEHSQIFPSGEEKVGWHEHDPLEIWENVVTCMDAVIQALLLFDNSNNNSNINLKAIGITNQRETTVAWNATTGMPYYNAIVWDDTRTTRIARQIETAAAAAATRSSDPPSDPDWLQKRTGLPCASYFAGTKVKWLLDHVPQLQEDLKTSPDQVRFGTIDTWLLYQLTGQPTTTTTATATAIATANVNNNNGNNAANIGGLFLTDVSNASRWLFMDIAKVQWDSELIDTVCHPHHLPLSALPEIRPSSQVYAICQKESTGIAALQNVPVAAILGDQQAALFGQCAFEPGEAKNTYGTGMFLMMNTGTQPVPSNHGLLTTIAYQLSGGDDQEVRYALEGSVSHSGSTIQWLRDQLKLITKASESETLASKHNDGLYLVPAFAGLFAPHWRSDARACIVGMTASHHKGHICRAALEAAAYQAREVFDAIYADSKVLLKSLKVDGGGTNNQLLMQFQADMINVPVVKPKVMETTAMGAAFGAGLAVGVWKDLQEIRDLWSVAETFKPKMTEPERQKNWAGWQKAVTKSLGWNTVDEEEEEDDEKFEDAMEGPKTEEEPAKMDVPTAIPRSKEVPDEHGVVSVGYGAFSLFLVAAMGVSAGFLLGRHRK